MALMPPAAFAVHQLRYWLAFGGHAGLFLNRQGHLYLHSLAPWLAVAVAIAIGAFLQALGRAFGGQRSLSRYTLSFTALWLICAAALVAIYTTQELLEGVLATGHPGGLVGVFGYGGWWSVPAALAVGLVLAAAFHGARWALTEVAERRSGSLSNSPGAHFRAAPALQRASPAAGAARRRLVGPRPASLRPPQHS